MTLWKSREETIEKSTAEIIAVKKNGEIVASSTFFGGIKLDDEYEKWCYLDELMEAGSLAERMSDYYANTYSELMYYKESMRRIESITRDASYKIHKLLEIVSLFENDELTYHVASIDNDIKDIEGLSK